MRDSVDIAIVGAGAAGLAAARRLSGERLEVALLEARSRVGGRAWTIEPMPGLAHDAGCEWLHTATRNPLAPLIEAAGFTLDRSLAHWRRRGNRLGISDDDAQAFARAFAALDARVAARAKAGDEGPVGDLLEPRGRWNPLLNAASGWYNGAEWDQISVLDYDAYDDGGVNWRVREGFGAAIAAAAGPLAPELACAVEVIDHGVSPIRLTTTRGMITARAVIIAVPTPHLAEGRIRFTPALPDKAAAAAGLPLGVADKAFLALARPELLPEEGLCFGAIDTEATASFFLRPFGRPYVEAYFGGALAIRLEEEGAGALTAFAIEQLGRAVGAEVGRSLSPLAETGWKRDPWSLGGYSHALPGHRADRARLAAPVDGRLFFAGEATHATFFSTAHGAWESGVRAAEEALVLIQRAP